jgi:nucleoid-associated protein YgaU
MLAKLALLKSLPLTYVAAAAVGSAGAIGAVTWHLTRSPAPSELAAVTAAPAPAPAPAAKAPEAAPPPVAQPAPPKPEAPAFDVARIEPSGEAVIAGRAAPGAKVELLRDGQVHDQTVADKAGEFVIIPKPLPRGAYDLSLRATEPSGEPVKSKDSVAVALGPDTRQRPVVALVAPDKPAEVLSRPAANAALKIAIDAVEAETAGKLYVSGRSAPGSSVRLYLNEAYIASATATREGRVAFAIESGVRPGDYQVRLDEVDGPSGKVQSRAEVPFTAPVPGKPPAAAAAATAAPEQGGRRAVASLDMSVAAQPPETRAEPARPVAPQTASPQAPARQAATPQVVSPRAVAPQQQALAPQALAPQAPASQAIAPQMAAPPTAASPTVAPQAAAPELASSQTITPSASEPAAGTPATAPSSQLSAAAQQPDVVVVPKIDTALVARGDSLWRISRLTYGRGARYSVIYEANNDQIRDPDRIYPGQVFVLPTQTQ